MVLGSRPMVSDNRTKVRHRADVNAFPKLIYYKGIKYLHFQPYLASKISNSLGRLEEFWWTTFTDLLWTEETLTACLQNGGSFRQGPPY